MIFNLKNLFDGEIASQEIQVLINSIMVLKLKLPINQYHSYDIISVVTILWIICEIFVFLFPLFIIFSSNSSIIKSILVYARTYWRGIKNSF